MSTHEGTHEGASASDKDCNQRLKDLQHAAILDHAMPMEYQCVTPSKDLVDSYQKFVTDCANTIPESKMQSLKRLIE